MAFFDLAWYCNAGDQSTTGHYAVAKRPQNATVAAGQLVRQFTAPAVGSERVFVCIIAGTTANVTDATWVLTRGAKTVDGTVTWMECTGASAVNGDLTNTPNWAAAKAINSAVTLGAIIQRNNGASYWICSTAGSTGASEPAWANNTAGTTQADSTVTWTCLGVVGNFTGGQAPHARLANAAATTWFVAGNTIYVGDNHAESQATAITISPASVSVMARIICHNHSGSYPPASTDLRTTATISTTAAANITVTLATQSQIYFYGLAFKAGVGSAGSANVLFTGPTLGFLYLDNCSLQIATTAVNMFIEIGTTVGTAVVFNNVTMSFGHTSQYVDIEFITFTWQNTGQVLVSGSAVPANFIVTQTSGRLCSVVLEALDLSQLTGNLFGTTFTLLGSLLIKDCKLNASAAVATPVQPGTTVQLVRSDSSGTGYKSARYQYEGTETTETSITRVGGATDPTGQAQSRKIVTTANSQWLRPFKAEPYAIWNPTTGANVTVTVCGTINAGALPNNDDIWLEVEYLGSSASPLGTIVTTTKANLLATGAAVASDGSTWSNRHTTFDGVPSAGIVMSNGNLTVTHGTTNNFTGVASTSFLNGGKYYFEITATPWGGAGHAHTIGLITPSQSFSTIGNAVVLGTASTFIFAAGVSTGISLGVTAQGDVFGFAVDVTNKLMWCRRNAGNWNNDPTANPATGVNGLAMGAGPFAPVVEFTNTGATDAFTANFGQTTFANAAPFSFLSWDTGWTPFKLTTTLSSPQPGMAGYLHARVRAAKPSTTFYVDPQITLS